jgi:uncharacterized protein YbaR (Trm112 family)
MPDSDIINDLFCPIGGAKLIPKGIELVCSKCGTVYPIIEGIPVLLTEHAKLPEGVSSLNRLKCKQDDLS